MAVLLVILMFAAFILADYLVTRRRAVRNAVRPVVSPPITAPEPVWVAGYQMPLDLHYHRGHTWARVLDVDTILIGLDDFARKLLGPARDVKLPAIGSWLHQGDVGFGVTVDGRAADLVSPVEGEVVGVNEALTREPGMVSDDPYGRGWILKVRPANLTTSLRNLFSGSLARRFMEDAREGLQLRLMALSGSVMQDGGEPVADFALHLPEDEWKRLVGEFLLS